MIQLVHGGRAIIREGQDELGTRRSVLLVRQDQELAAEQPPQQREAQIHFQKKKRIPGACRHGVGKKSCSGQVHREVL